MKNWILASLLALLSVALMPSAAEAKRIGSGGSSGMQRALPSRSPAMAPTPNPAQTAPGVAPGRSWMGPIAGLAAGLGIAALMSHFGMGGDLGNIVTMLLVAALAFVAIRFLLRRFAPAGPPRMASSVGGGTMLANVPTPPPASTPFNPRGLPAGFDAPGFERLAKMIFIRMQTANDAADLNDLHAFTTPEMFASVKLDLQDRNGAAQETDVVRVDASVLEMAIEAGQQIVSVRFHGLIREEKNGAAEAFDEVWHLVKPTDGSREWAIAGIQQTA